MDGRNCNIGSIIKALDSTIMKRTLEIIPEEERLPIMQGWIISYLHDNKDKDIFQKDIEKDFHIARSTVTSLVKQMEKEGFIARVSVERDSRLKKLVLLEQGEDRCNLIEGRINSLEESMREGISQKDMNVFFSVVYRMLDNLGCSGCHYMKRKGDGICFQSESRNQ